MSGAPSPIRIMAVDDHLSLPKTSSACRHSLLKKMIEAALK